MDPSITPIVDTIYQNASYHWAHGTPWCSEELVQPPYSDFYEAPDRKIIAERIQRIIHSKNISVKELDLSQLGEKLGIKRIDDCRTWCKPKKTTLV